MKLWTAFAIMLFAAALIACTQQTPQTPTQQTAGDTGDTNNAPGDTGADNTATGTTGNTVEINMTAENFAFAPNTITVRQGDRVIIHITDSDDEHGIGIQGYDEQVKFDAGTNVATLEFVADKAGTFTFYCNVPCGPGHRQMTGQLIVEA